MNDLQNPSSLANSQEYSPWAIKSLLIKICRRVRDFINGEKNSTPEVVPATEHNYFKKLKLGFKDNAVMSSISYPRWL